MPTANKDEMTERAQLVRVFEAAADIEYPTPDERNFRRAVMIKLGLAFGLKEIRNKEITGPAMAPPATGAQPAAARPHQPPKR